MLQEREITVAGTTYTVTISDEQEALLAAKAAGRAIVGLLHDNGDDKPVLAEYLAESLEAVDDQYLERVVRRHLVLPWQIAETERLILREFTMEDIKDVPREPKDQEADTIFYTPEKLSAYIRGQYRFYEHGIWAVVRKSDGMLLGKAGLSACEAWGQNENENMAAGAAMQMEMGYHIFETYRRRGYALEACRAILSYAEEEMDCPVYASVDSANRASIGLLTKLNFHLVEQRYTKAGQLQYLYGWNC